MLILTTFGLDTYVYDALHAGASGFMLKDAPRGDCTAVRIVAAGEALLAPAVTRMVIEEFVRRQEPTQTVLPPAGASRKRSGDLAVGTFTPRASVRSRPDRLDVRERRVGERLRRGDRDAAGHVGDAEVRDGARA